MPITEILARNAALYGEEISLVEINPEIKEVTASWKDYELVETNPEKRYRREMTWREFDDKANRFANFLLGRGLTKGHKVGILLMNCLEWLPVYFGILKQELSRCRSTTAIPKMKSNTASIWPNVTF